ncbi:hypothetical protein NCAS_0H02260 [Naumovozyma castellii]|uniref:Calcineurin-like phosphoesterase domain-containing protein n=1 Tax=Naumovozyma castellii TaxID=27288 RepID=G0VJ57_NAUCA|nr:hypothetical protein NCAS_0H02260 [Naumovozyma castellii CBS 4309]CCC71536.1 hypothetical protein NCAS_0H02260 [Naumovozyma castellii CBS 4309]
MRLKTRRIVKTSQRLLQLLIFFILCNSLGSLRNHLKNVFRQDIPEEYTGGPITDIQCIPCFYWYQTCGSIIWNDQKWLRVSKNLSDESLYSMESGPFSRSFLYVRQDTGEKPISDIAISSDPLMIPVHVTQDINNLLQSSDSSVYHNHKFHQKGSSWRASWSWFWNSGKVLASHDHADDASDSTMDDISLRGENWKYKGYGIWCKFDNTKEIVANIEIFLGSLFLESRPYWREVIHEFKPDDKLPLPISITVKIATNVKEETGELNDGTLKMDSKFKILQVSDVHFRSSINSMPMLKEYQTMQFITNTITRELPNLVIVTGDILDSTNSIDYQTCIMNLVQPMIKFKIPYIITLGSADYSEYASRDQIINFISTLPYSLTKFSTDNGHLIIPLHKFNDPKGEVSQDELMIYVIDSFHSIENDVKFKEIASKPVDWEYALAFRSLPIPQYRPDGLFPIIGQYNERTSLELRENVGTAVGNVINLQDFLISKKVKSISCGHEHNNDCCLQSKNEMWLCYGGSTGVGTKRMEGLFANVRLFDIDTDIGEITSWKRNMHLIDNVYDYQYIYKRE